MLNAAAPGPAATADQLLDAVIVEGEPAAIAVAVVDSHDVALRTSGCTGSDRFEIGSITKTMTATVLASLVVDGVLRLDDAIGNWIRARRNGAITLRELATHASGLPRLAPNWRRGDGFRADDPYAAFDADRAMEGLTGLRQVSGGRFEYSNFGFQLLGLVLQEATGVPFEHLLREHVFRAAGMTSAGVSTGGGTVADVQGHDHGWATPHWTFQPALAGHGGVLASITDLTAYARAVLDPPRRARRRRHRAGDRTAVPRRPG